MPVFEVKFKRANEPLDRVERMWVETIINLLEDEKLRQHYTQKVLQRVRDFDIEKIAEGWSEILMEIQR